MNRILGRSTGKKISPADIAVAVRQVVESAARQEVSAVLVGGVAMQEYGSPRFTSDVDFTTSRVLEGYPKGKPLSFGGVATKAKNGVRVDFIVRDDDYEPLYEEVFTYSLAIDKNDRKLGRIAKPEILFVLKNAANRPKDQEDMRFLLSQKSLKLDMDLVKKLTRKHLGLFALRELDSFIAEAAWLNKNARKIK